MGSARYKLLLIEDDKLDRMAFKRLMEDEQLAYDCTIAGSVSEARSILDCEQFDIVISDYFLGDGTGFDILDLVKNSPIIFVTGAGDEEIAVKAWKMGAYDYLIKDNERNYLKAVPVTVENAIRHKRTEERLQLLSGAVMSTEDSVYISDMQSRIIFVNKAFCETYGYNEEDVIGKEDCILWSEKPSEDSTRGICRDVESGCVVGFYHRRKDGSEFPVSLSRSVIKGENGNDVAVVGVARNISDRIVVEDELRTENLQLKEENQLKSELAVTASDALWPLLATFKDIIRGAMTGSFGPISPELRENLELADRNIDRATGIISELQDISKPMPVKRS